MCGIAGCYGTPHAPLISRLGLYNVQNRGQEWVGFAACDGNKFYPEGAAPLRKEGLVMDVLTNATMRSMMGHMAFGHVRYSTQGASELHNAQPHSAMTSDGPILFASNGDIVNCHQLRTMLKEHGITFYSDNDGEVILSIKKAIGLEEHDVLYFMSLEGLKSCVDDPHNWCFACLSGEYPTNVQGFVPLHS